MNFNVFSHTWWEKIHEMISIRNNKRYTDTYTDFQYTHYHHSNCTHRHYSATKLQTVAQTLRMKLNRAPRTQKRSKSSNRGRLGPDPQIPIGSSDVTYEA